MKHEWEFPEEECTCSAPEGPHKYCWHCGWIRKSCWGCECNCKHYDDP